MKFALFAFIILLMSKSRIFAQLGCTDPNALNYDSAALVNDGSCLYPPTSLNCPVINVLPNQVQESSGLVFFGGMLWTHNDSGNAAKLYGFDTINYQIQDTLVISNITNIDWEDLAASSEYVFIGDFGNNTGSRTNLRILRINLSDALNLDTVEVEEISFSYPDQTNFSPSSNHSFDCEAFFFHNDSLHLFTKHWGNGYTKHYKLPNEIGNHTAIFVDSLLVNGQITAADISPLGIISLLGYSPPLYAPFMYLLWDYQGTQFFTGNKRNLEMGSVLDMGQQEGLVFSSNLKGIISSEQISSPIVIQARFFSFDLAPIFNAVSGIVAQESNPKMTIFPNPSKGSFSVFIPTELVGAAHFQITDISGKTLFEAQIQLESHGFTWQGDLSKGIYFLKVIDANTNQAFFERFIVE
jgi:hypothetical protein